MGECREKCAGKLEFADHDLERDVQHLIEFDCGVKLATCLQQSLQPDDLLLSHKCFIDFHVYVPEESIERGMSIFQTIVRQRCLIAI